MPEVVVLNRCGYRLAIVVLERSAGAWWVWVGDAGSVLADGSGSRYIAGGGGVRGVPVRACWCWEVGGKVRGE